MDKNTWIGFGLIALILIGFSFFNRPSKEELARRQHYRDSIALVQQQKEAEAAAVAVLDSINSAADMDSAVFQERHEQILAQYGNFAVAAEGEKELFAVENDVLRLVFSTQGAGIYSAELKNYKAYGDSVNNLQLFIGAERELNYTLVTRNDRVLSTCNLFFQKQEIHTDNAGNQVVTLRLMTDVEDSYIDFVYTIPQADYMIGFDIKAHNMQQILAANLNALEMDWNQIIPQQERGRKFEERYAQLQYMFMNRDMEKLSEAKHDQEKENAKIRWVAYKDQFFSSVMISEDGFESSVLESTPQGKDSRYIKEYKTNTSFFFDPSGEKVSAFRMYLGPNHYNTLKAYDKGKQKYELLNLRSLVPLGWEIVAWINRILVIPMFDLFTSWGIGIGWVILLMTLVIKLIILPFTFKSYQSSAKMRVLKPQLDEINAKYPPEKMQERQQETMKLYSKAGVSPMSGCLPMLFQMPVVMAMFWFFPTAIELRGQSFLWADDLSAYDAILSWDMYIPIISWAFNNHISLFTLLMTATNIVYTVLNMQTQAGGNDPSMKMMKWMMYLMPVMFLFIFNDYAAGLSYYYFISLLITILQTMVFRWTLNDQRVLEQMAKAQAKKQNKKKSGFMARLEQVQREQQARMREQIKEQAKQNRR